MTSIYHIGTVYVKSLDEIDFEKVVKIYKKLGIQFFNGCKDKNYQFLEAVELKGLVWKCYNEVDARDEGSELSICCMTFRKASGRMAVSLNLNILHDNHSSNKEYL